MNSFPEQALQRRRARARPGRPPRAGNSNLGDENDDLGSGGYEAQPPPLGRPGGRDRALSPTSWSGVPSLDHEAQQPMPLLVLVGRRVGNIP